MARVEKKVVPKCNGGDQNALYEPQISVRLAIGALKLVHLSSISEFYDGKGGKEYGGEKRIRAGPGLQETEKTKESRVGAAGFFSSGFLKFFRKNPE